MIFSDPFSPSGSGDRGCVRKFRDPALRGLGLKCEGYNQVLLEGTRRSMCTLREFLARRLS